MRWLRNSARNAFDQARADWKVPVSLLAASIGVVYLLAKVVVINPVEGLDLRLIWLAGRLWQTSQNPYGADFEVAYAEEFGLGPNTHFWVYPPYWLSISTAISLVPFQQAVVIWKVLNFVAIVVATCVFSRAFRAPLYATFTCIGFACLMQATAVTITIGQTSILVYLGLGFFASGFINKRSGTLVAGLIILALKPNIAAPFFIAALVRFPRQTIIASLILAVACAPIFTLETFTTFAENLGRYSAPNLDANLPFNLVGAVHFLEISSIGVNSFLLVAIAAVLITLTLIKWGNQLGVSLAIILATFFVPVHAYDLVPLSSLIFVVAMAKGASRWIVAAGLLISFRSANLASVTGLELARSNVFPESLTASLALLLILAGLVLLAVSGKSEIESGPPLMRDNTM